MMDFEKIKKIMRRLGESKMVVSDDNETLVIMTLDEYEALSVIGAKEGVVDYVDEKLSDNYGAVEVKPELNESVRLANHFSPILDQDRVQKKDDSIVGVNVGDVMGNEKDDKRLSDEVWIEKQLEEMVEGVGSEVDTNTNKAGQLDGIESLLKGSESVETVHYEEYNPEVSEQTVVPLRKFKQDTNNLSNDSLKFSGNDKEVNQYFEEPV